MTPPPALYVALASEDSSKTSHEVLGVLVSALFKRVEPAMDTSGVEFSPPCFDALTPTKWRTRKLRDALLRFARAVVTNLLTDERAFVVVHADGDTRWSERSQSTTHDDFTTYVLSKIRSVLRQKVEAAQAEDVLERLFLLVPFYSVESWTYQNTAQALHVCDERGWDDERARFEEWEQDRAALDEVLKPKALSRLGSKYNLRLAATQYPAEAVEEAQTSFHAAVEQLRACAPLCAALRFTYERWNS